MIKPTCITSLRFDVGWTLPLHIFIGIMFNIKTVKVKYAYDCKLLQQSHYADNFKINIK